MPRKIRCVTFDCYGTLIDWQGGIERALLAVPELGNDLALVRRVIAAREETEKGLLVSAPDLPEDDSPAEMYETPEYRPYGAILTESIVLAARACGIELSGCAAEDAASTMPSWEPFADTCRALARIKKRFPIAILSNVEESVIRSSISKLGVSFDLVITAERVESYKPAPDHWYAAMHELGADEEELFHLAASPFHDLETASLLGIPCGYVNRAGYQMGPEARPAFVVRNLAEAADRLEGSAIGPRTGPTAEAASRRPRRRTQAGAHKVARPDQSGPKRPA